MIILREKEFASTKESKRKVKKANEEDKTRRNLDYAQAGTAAAGVGTIITGSKLRKAAERGGEKLNESKKGIPVDMNFANKNQKKGKIAKGMDKASLALIGTSVGLGIAKHARDVKKAKEEKK